MVNDEFRIQVRPKPISYFKPIPTPVKDNAFFHSGRQQNRTENKHTNIPQKDYIPAL